MEAQDATGAGKGQGRNFARFIRAGLRTAADLVLPPTCLACRKPVGEPGGLCPLCWNGIGFIERPYCEKLGTPFVSETGEGLLSPAAIADPPAYDRARAAMRFGDVARELVHLMKYGDRLDLARPFGRWMVRAGRELLADADALVPVPLHWSRLFQRRFNQSALLARSISRHAGTPVLDDVLQRTRATPPQVGLARKERAQNVQGAFAVAPGARVHVKGRKLIVIDDVLTSGATADACARVLRRAGASRVDVLVLARVVNFD
jgi:ComF family protein